MLCKYCKYTHLITTANTDHWYWQMVKLLKQKRFLWISYPDLPVHSDQQSQGKGKGKKKKKERKQTNKHTNQTTKERKPGEGLRSTPLSFSKYSKYDQVHPEDYVFMLS